MRQASHGIASERSRVSHLGFLIIIVLVLDTGLGLLFAPADEVESVSVDIRYPATILSLLASRLRAVQSCVSKLLDGANAGRGETIGKHGRPKESLDQWQSPAKR